MVMIYNEVKRFVIHEHTHYNGDMIAMSKIMFVRQITEKLKPILQLLVC